MNEVARTTCLCNHKSHKIVLLADGSVATPDHPEALDQGRRLAAFARLGKPFPVQGCASVVALVHGADVLCQYWSPSNLMEAPAAWKRALVEFRSDVVIRFAMAAALAKRFNDTDQSPRARQRAAKHEATVSRLMVELGRCSWFEGQPFDLATGLRSEALKEWGEVGALEPWHLVMGRQRLRIPLQNYWLDLAENGRMVYNDKLIVGEDSDDPRTVYAIHRDPDQAQLRVSAFQRSTRLERLERK